MYFPQSSISLSFSRTMYIQGNVICVFWNHLTVIYQNIAWQIPDLSSRNPLELFDKWFFFLTSESESLKLLWKNPEQRRVFFSNYLPNSRGASSISNTQQPWRQIFGGAGHSEIALCAQGLPHWEPPQSIWLQQNWVSLDEFAALLVPAEHPAQMLQDLTVSSPFKLSVLPTMGLH